MLKAKALCAVNGNAAPEIRPLMSVVEALVPAADTHGNDLHDLIGGMQNIVIESVGSDEKIPEAERGLKVYDLDYKSFQIARHRGVLFHKGNRYRSNTKKQELDEFDTPEDIKRILVGNMIALANLMNGVDCQRFGIMETMRPVQELPITDGCIIRTAANVQLDEESILLYEVVRSTSHEMRKLADKVSRYYTRGRMKMNHRQRFPELIGRYSVEQVKGENLGRIRRLKIVENKPVQHKNGQITAILDNKLVAVGESMLRRIGS